MSWSSMNDVPNPIFDANGDPYSGAVLKAYLPGTTTVTSLDISSSGASPQTSITANAQGKWEVSGNEVIPHIDRKHKWAIFANATDAAANTPAYMGFFDNVEQVVSASALPTIGKAYATLALAVAATEIADGDALNIAERTSGNGGGASWDVKLLSSGAANTFNRVAWGNNPGDATDLVLVLREEAYEADTIKWGVLADNSDNSNESIIQAAIDHINATYLAAAFGGEAGEVILPAGLIRYSSLIIKKGVNLVGQGQANTVLLFDTDGGTGIKTPAKTSQVAADQVSQSTIKGITFGVHSSLTPSISTVLLDTSGMTRCTFDDLSFVVPSNTIGVDNTGNTLAASGGFANWYNIWNQCFVDCSGGIGVRWGDNDSSIGEQVTAQTWIGGRIGGTSGVGIHIRGGAGNNFHGTTFEGLNGGGSDTIIIGDSTGARTSTSNNMHGCYFEQVDITYYSNSSRCRRWGGLETSLTETDTGTSNGRVDEEQLYLGWSRNYASGRITAPTTINKSYNVASVTNPGTGIYEITFADAMPDTNYICIGQAESSDLTCRTSTKTSLLVRLLFFNAAGAATAPTSFCFLVQDNQ